VHANSDPLIKGQKIASQFLNNDLSSIWSESTQEMRDAFGSVDELKKFQKNVFSEFGLEQKILSERAETKENLYVYTRVSQWTKISEHLELTIAISDEEMIAGFLLRQQPAVAQSTHLDYQTKTILHLPVNGKWFVYWGGRTVEDNYHAVNVGQRFAMDLLILRNGKSHNSEANSLKAYYCWEQPILAPAPGIVVRAVNDLPDQKIGECDPRNPLGNHIVINFGNEEYGFFAHFRQNSLRVSVGDKILTGQEIGLCGNSGNSSEPHLHFHLQTNPDLDKGEGLPAQFTNYLASDILIARGEPKRGEFIQSLN
jgi:hypothetical protein